MSDPFPPALPHGELEEPLPGVFFVTGTLAMNAAMRFSRNMTVVREGERLVLLNTLRLSPAGLDALDALGKVTDVVRLAGFHGMDDRFYKDRYGAKVWAIRGQRYRKAFETQGPPYFEPDVEVGPGDALPLEGASLHVFSCTPPEAILVLPRHGGIAITGDSLQNWATTDRYFSLPAKVAMKLMGFVKPHNIGPGWAKAAKPAAAELRAVLDLEFEHLLPAHGAAVLGGAKASYRPVIEAFGR